MHFANPEPPNQQAPQNRRTNLEMKRAFRVVPHFRRRPVYSAAFCLWVLIVGGGFALASTRGLEFFQYVCLGATALLALGHAADCVIYRRGNFWEKMNAMGLAGAGGFLLGTVAGLLQLPLLIVAYNQIESDVYFSSLLLIPVLGLLIASIGIFITYLVIYLTCGFLYNAWKTFAGAVWIDGEPKTKEAFRFFLFALGLIIAGYAVTLNLAIEYAPGRSPGHYNVLALIGQMVNVIQGIAPRHATIEDPAMFNIARNCLYGLVGVGVLIGLRFGLPALRRRRENPPTGWQ